MKTFDSQFRQPLITGISLLALAAILGACSQPATQPATQPTAQPAAQAQPQGSAQLPILAIKTANLKYDAPDTVNAGWTEVTFENNGQGPHQAQLMRLNDGVTMQQFGEAAQKAPGAAFALVKFVGGPGAISPGQKETAYVNLTPGQHLILDLIPGPDGVPNMAKGMLRPFEVKAGSSATEPPKADMTITMKDFQFTHPMGEVKAGPQVWKVVNEGEQPHEMQLVKLADGKTVQDAAAWFAAPQGPPPYQAVGGMQGLSKGGEGFISLDLTPGNYVMLCLVPDSASGKSHLELGMVMPFSVK